MGALALNTLVLKQTLLALTLVAPLAAADENSGPLCARCRCSDILLNCTSVQLQTLPTDAVNWPADVEVALFDGSDISHLLKLPELPKLRVLSLRSNRIQKIDDDSFSGLPALQKIDLGSNQMTQMTMRPEIFRGKHDNKDYEPLKNLTELYLDYNSIHALDTEVFEHLPNVKVLSLSSNPIRRAEGTTMIAISSLMYLESLDLSYTYLEALPAGMLHSLLHLHSLNLSGNAFTLVPEQLEEAHDLRELRLSSNPIRSLEKGSFPGELRSLRFLELNYLKNLSRVGAGTFTPLLNLTALHLSHSLALKEIDKEAFVSSSFAGNITYPPLHELILRGNSLQSLDPEMVLWLGLKLIDLQDNLWMCDCELQWAVDVLEPIINTSHPEMLRNVICEYPEPMRGYSLFSLHARHYHLRCLDMDGAHPENDTAILIGVLIGVLLAVPATLAAVLFWKRGGFTWLGGGGAASYSRAFYRRTNNIDDF